MLTVITIYSFMQYDSMTVNEFQLLKGAKESSNIFKTPMALQIVFCVTIIIIERFVNRSDTKEVKDEIPTTKDASYFQSKIFKQGQGHNS